MDSLDNASQNYVSIPEAELQQIVDTFISSLAPGTFTK